MDAVDTILTILKDKVTQPDLPPELVTHSATTMSRSIFAHWHRLNAIVDRHEGTIRGRWKKRSPAKRRELLGAVFPEIPDVHRPDMDDTHFGCTDCSCEDVWKPTPSRELWPYINSEDLSDATSLLVYINARACNRPATFASSEFSFSGMAIPCHVTRYSHITVLLTDQDPDTQDFKEEMYGRVIGFGDGTKAEFEDEEENPGYYVALALQILRIQEGILKFLVGCCEHIMHDILPETLGSDAYPLSSELPSLSEQGDMSSSLADACRKAPYGARGVPNFARIRYLISTVLEKLEDHAWALREDPVYFAEHIQNHADHRHENILNEAGEPSLRLGTRAFYSPVLREILSKAYSNLILQDELYRLSRQLEALHESTLHAEASEELSKRYLDAVETMYFMLVTGSYDAVGLIEHFSMGAPQLRHLLVRVPIPGNSEDRAPGESDYMAMPVETGDVVGSRVRTLLSRATKFSHIVDFSHFSLDCLETYCRREPSAREKLSPFIEDILSTLSVCVECLHQLRVSSCYAKLKPHFHSAQISRVYPKWYLAFMRPFKHWTKILTQRSGGVVAPDLGNPTDGKFDYPSETVRTKQTVEARRKAERNLDKFWRYVDNAFRKRTGYSQHDTIRRLLDKGGPMKRTAPWYDPEDLGATPTSSIVYEYQPISEIFHDSTKEITGNFNRLAVAGKTKTKTHGEMVAVTENVNQNINERPAIVSKPLYRVGKDAYVVIKALFHVPNDSEPPGKVRWDQIVATLTKLGFSVEKLHGSAWQFSPKKLDLPRGIQFHEPHLSGEVPLTLARRYGRRLTRAYGWEGAMFKQN